MKTKIISTAVIAAFSMALAVNAAEGEQKKKGGGFASLDKNGDGSVDKAEYMASPAAQKDTGKAEARFKTLDKNGDGKLSKEEFEAGQKKKN
jgi:hypothetical protein